MFKNSYQAGFLSILYSIGSKPLQIWSPTVRNGHIKRTTDEDIQSSVIEIVGNNVSTCYITCPADPKKTLGIKLPFLVLIIKNLRRYFSFEITILDDQNIRRRFRVSTYQTMTRVRPFVCTMPLRLDEGWNQIQFNLADFTRRAYGTNYLETLHVQVHANCRLRRLYFSDRLYAEEELPAEFRLYMPISSSTRSYETGAGEDGAGASAAAGMRGGNLPDPHSGVRALAIEGTMTQTSDTYGSFPSGVPAAPLQFATAEPTPANAHDQKPPLSA